MAKPNKYAEGRSEKNLKYVVWKPSVGIPLHNRYLERKKTRLFMAK
jgi:hypothetical protein